MLLNTSPLHSFILSNNLDVQNEAPTHLSCRPNHITKSWAKSRKAASIIGLVLASISQHVVAANEDLLSATYRGWWNGSVQEEFFIGSCHVKAHGGKDSSLLWSERHYLRTITCQKGEGANWHGSWKTEFRQGPCLIQQTAQPEVFVEKVSCNR